MRVVHIVGDLGLYGAENVVALLMQHTHEPDLQLHAMTVNRSDHPEARARAGARVIAIDRTGRRDVGFIVRMVLALRRLRPDVVHTHAHHGRYWGRLAALMAGVPLIVHTEHNSDLVPPAPRWVFSALNRFLNPRTAAFIDFTQRRRAELAAAEGIPLERIVVIPNGMPLREPAALGRVRARAVMGVGPEEFAIVVVARLYGLKRHDLAIDAVAELPETTRAKTRLIFVGDGPLRHELEARAEARGIGDRVAFLGFRTDARSLFSGADVALVTSEREAMPLAVIEAMLENAPIVSTPWAGADAMLGGGEYGLIAGAFTPAAVSAALKTALTDRTAAARRVAAAGAHARVEFDGATQAARYAALYRELSARRRSASRVITAARS